MSLKRSTAKLLSVAAKKIHAEVVLLDSAGKDLPPGKGITTLFAEDPESVGIKSERLHRRIIPLFRKLMHELVVSGQYELLCDEGLKSGKPTRVLPGNKLIFPTRLEQLMLTAKKLAELADGEADSESLDEFGAYYRQYIDNLRILLAELRMLSDICSRDIQQVHSIGVR